MSLDKETQSALIMAQDALSERDRIRRAITEAEAELASAEAELAKIRMEFARERAAAVLNSKSRTSKGPSSVAAARERIESLKDEIEGLRMVLSEGEDDILAAKERLAERVASLKESVLSKYVPRYRAAVDAFVEILKEGLALQVTLDVSLPGLRATQVFLSPLSMNMPNLGSTSASGEYSGPIPSSETQLEFGPLRQALDAANREARKIQQGRQEREILERRQREENGKVPRSSTHYVSGEFRQ